MKKSKIIISTIIVILIIVLIYIVLEYIDYKYQEYEFAITDINNNTIITEKKSGVDATTGEIFYTRYKLFVDSALIINENGKKINFTDLKIGDQIFVINKRKKVENDLYSDPEYLHNVKFIKIINSK